MTKSKGISIGKFEKNGINEDAVACRNGMIAVSDGAGGGGLFADRWSRYLVRKPPKSPITNAEALDKWIEGIWEAFYDKAEGSAKRLGGMALDKFYDEGAFATLAAVWRDEDNICRWMMYGDSVVFHYDYRTGVLTHSFSSLLDFNRPPFLINCKDELNHAGFHGGEFGIADKSLVFVASDALSHFVIMMYEVSKREEYAEELRRAAGSGSKNGNFVNVALSLPSVRFERDVIDKLRRAAYDRKFCERWLRRLVAADLLAHDDYSFAVMYL